MPAYDHKSIEHKWQKRWEESGAFRASDDQSKKKYYPLIEFPYPSGAGLHVGHPRPYIGLDIIARKRRREGYNVLYPIGWDAFGLPTENYAIKTGKDPREVTKENTETFKRQIKSLGVSFDWSREINTTDPQYYRWTQWIFLKLFEHRLAYKAKTTVNWCPKDKIGLANEEVVDGKCERCGTEVEKREKEQWMLAITKYAKRLYDDLDTVDYIERAKVQQRNWIGPSEGALIKFPLSDIFGQEDNAHFVEVFTTRPDTIYGATFIAISPELAKRWIGIGWQVSNEVRAYVAAAISERMRSGRKEIEEKTGIFSGISATNPASGEKIPVWVTNYVLGEVGTGAIMAVPAHDERDFDFAKKFNLPIKRVVSEYVVGETLGEVQEKLIDHLKVEKPYAGEGKLVDSGEFTREYSQKAKKLITEKVGGTWTTTYKLRDWVFSRQRYWGEPIPMVKCEKDGWVPLPENELPLVLPPIEKYEYTDDGDSPLAHLAEWVNTTCPKCGGPARRETDTMPNWAGSSWYYLRYTDPANATEFASRPALGYFTPVDWYNGGMEHTVLHLLYSRFWHKFLFDLGLVPTAEPYQKRTSHGLILAEGNEKMSKSKGNVVNPDEVVERFGADSLRTYEMFMGPFDQAIAWSTDGLVGTRRFLERVLNLKEKVKEVELSPELAVSMNQTIKKVSEDIELLKMNTAVAALMTFANELASLTEVPQAAYHTLLSLLDPFAPHICGELWETTAGEGALHEYPWPQFDPAKLTGATVTIALQVNGKTRGVIEIPKDAAKDEALQKARELPAISSRLEGRGEPRVIYVPQKLINFVISGEGTPSP